MRTYLYSIARSRTPGSRFTQMSLGDIPMALLYDYYDSHGLFVKEKEPFYTARAGSARLEPERES